jgi:hypothetical protein
VSASLRNPTIPYTRVTSSGCCHARGEALTHGVMMTPPMMVTEGEPVAGKSEVMHQFQSGAHLHALDLVDEGVGLPLAVDLRLLRATQEPEES